MNPLLLTVGNIYIDHNVFGVNTGDNYVLESGKDYFGERGDRVLGGSAVNAAMQAKRLGLEVGFIGKTGDDMGSQEVRAMLEKEAIIADLMSRDAAYATSMAVNLVAKDGEFIGIHYGTASRTLDATAIDISHELLRRASAVYFGGTAKQPLLFKDCAAVFASLGSRGIKVFYDPNRFPAQEQQLDRALLKEQLKHVEIYFPNEDELLQATGAPTIDEALGVVIDAGARVVALKCGAEGCRIKTRADDFTIDGHKVSVITTVGAGDCFNATFMAHYLNGDGLRDCAIHATAAAAIKVSQNVWPTRDMIKKFL